MELYHDSGREDKSMVYEVLKVGERNALSPDYLRVTLRLTSNRAVQKQIEHERKQGKVINCRQLHTATGRLFLA